MLFIKDLIQEDLSELDSTDLLQIMSYSGLTLERLGRDKYQTLCPFHNDKDTPSLRVYTNSNTWSCFSPNCSNPHNSDSRNGGGAIEFVKQYHHLSFKEACDWIKENFGKGYSVTIVEKPKPKSNVVISNSSVSYYHKLIELYPENKKWFNNRLIDNNTIRQQHLGWDGDNHVIPIWKNEPLVSDCIAIKLRTHDQKVKYIRLGSYEPYLYNIHSCVGRKTIYAFAGELDALLASQLGLGAFSVINGAMSFKEVPDWPNLFPDAEKLIVVFDKKEAVAGSLMASDWQKHKGKFTARTFLWPPFDGDDFTDFVLDRSFGEFMSLVKFY